MVTIVIVIGGMNRLHFGVAVRIAFIYQHTEDTCVMESSQWMLIKCLKWRESVPL